MAAVSEWCQDRLCEEEVGWLTHVDGGIVQVADAVGPVERGALGLADGRHDRLLGVYSFRDDIGYHIPLDHRRADHLPAGGRSKASAGKAVFPRLVKSRRVIRRSGSHCTDDILGKTKPSQKFPGAACSRQFRTTIFSRGRFDKRRPSWVVEMISATCLPTTPALETECSQRRQISLCMAGSTPCRRKIITFFVLLLTFRKVS